MCAFYTSPIKDADIQMLETSVIKEYGLTDVGEELWKEAVGQALLMAWRLDKTDTRIVTYCMPIILYQMLRRKNLLMHSDWDDVFQGVVLATFGFLGGYCAGRGSLFTYLTMKVQFEVIDLATAPKIVHSRKTIEVEVEEDTQVGEDNAVYQFNDFIGYIGKLHQREGRTSRRILEALLYIVLFSDFNIQKQYHLVEALRARTKLPKLIVQSYLERVLRDYQATWNASAEEVTDADPGKDRCASSARIA
jgi:hypothetical protein